jgi:hypothetical protein
MKYVLEMDPVAMIWMANFIKTGSGIQKLMGGGITGTQHGNLINLILLFAYFPEASLCDLNACVSWHLSPSQRLIL